MIKMNKTNFTEKLKKLKIEQQPNWGNNKLYKNYWSFR